MAATKNNELKQLLLEYEHLVPDVPTITNNIYQNDEIVNFTPVKQHQYIVSQTGTFANTEIQCLLLNDFLEPCESN